jgi:hypothetical protein
MLRGSNHDVVSRRFSCDSPRIVAISKGLETLLVARPPGDEADHSSFAQAIWGLVDRQYSLDGPLLRRWSEIAFSHHWLKHRSELPPPGHGEAINLEDTTRKQASGHH